MAVCFDALNEGQKYTIHYGPGNGSITHRRVCYFKGLECFGAKPRRLAAVFVNGNGIIVEVLDRYELVAVESIRDKYNRPR